MRRMRPDEVDTDMDLVGRSLAGQLPRWADLRSARCRRPARTTPRRRRPARGRRGPPPTTGAPGAGRPFPAGSPRATDRLARHGAHRPGGDSSPPRLPRAPRRRRRAQARPERRLERGAARRSRAGCPADRSPARPGLGGRVPRLRREAAADPPEPHRAAPPGTRRPAAGRPADRRVQRDLGTARRPGRRRGSRRVRRRDQADQGDRRRAFRDGRRRRAGGRGSGARGGGVAGRRRRHLPPVELAAVPPDPARSGDDPRDLRPRRARPDGRRGAGGRRRGPRRRPGRGQPGSPAPPAETAVVGTLRPGEVRARKATSRGRRRPAGCWCRRRPGWWRWT